MKKLIPYLLLAIIITFAFTSEKEYSVKYTIPQWEAKLQLIETTKKAIQQSNLPVNFANPLTDSLSLFQNELKSQLIKQLNDTTKKK